MVIRSLKKNALLPTDVTLSGLWIVVRLLSANAYSPMDITLSGMVTLSSPNPQTHYQQLKYIRQGWLCEELVLQLVDLQSPKLVLTFVAIRLQAVWRDWLYLQFMRCETLLVPARNLSNFICAYVLAQISCLLFPIETPANLPRHPSVVQRRDAAIWPCKGL